MQISRAANYSGSVRFSRYGNPRGRTLTHFAHPRRRIVDMLKSVRHIHEYVSHYYRSMCGNGTKRDAALLVDKFTVFASCFRCAASSSRLSRPPAVSRTDNNIFVISLLVIPRFAETKTYVSLLTCLSRDEQTPYVYSARLHRSCCIIFSDNSRESDDSRGEIRESCSPFHSD